jgi:hypothetical protein
MRLRRLAPEKENETPQIKETHPEVSGTNPESPIPQAPSIPLVSLYHILMQFLFHQIQSIVKIHKCEQWEDIRVSWKITTRAIRIHFGRNNNTQNGWKHRRLDRPIPRILG